MSIRYGFFDAEGGEGNWDRTYTAEDFTDYLGTLVTSGVQRGYENELAPLEASAGRVYYIRSGKAWIKGRYLVSDSNIEVNYNGDTYTPTQESTYWLCVVAYCNTSERECGIKSVYLGDEYYTPVDTDTEFYVPLCALQVYFDGSHRYSVVSYEDVREFSNDPAFGGSTTDCGTIEIVSGVVSLTDCYAKKSSGSNSVAVGKSEASSVETVAAGYYAEASGMYSVAVGSDSEATGGDSVAVGYSAKASEDNTIAVGATAQATGKDSIAAGRNTSAGSTDSVAIGYRAETAGSGKGHVALGYQATGYGGGYGNIAIGYKATTTGGIGHIAIGYEASATDSGFGNIAIGYETSAPMHQSIVIGYDATAVEDGQLILGYYPEVEENYKVVIGDGTSDEKRHNLLTIDNDGIMEINGSAVNTLAISKSDYDALVARVEALESKLGG